MLFYLYIYIYIKYLMFSLKAVISFSCILDQTTCPFGARRGRNGRKDGLIHSSHQGADTQFSSFFGIEYVAGPRISTWF